MPTAAPASPMLSAPAAEVSASTTDPLRRPGSSGEEHTAGPPPHSESAAAQFAFTSYLRVAAIVGVVLIHTAGLTYGNEELRKTDVWWVAALVTFSVKWAVPLFVMVSGALLLKPPANRSAAVFYRRRLSRIGIPLVFWHVVFITLASTILVSTPRPRIIIARFLRGESFTGLYFFWLILGLYVITPLLWPLVAGLSRRALGGVGAALVALAAINMSALRVVSRLEDSRPIGDPSLFSAFVPFIGFFILGYALRDVIVRGRGRILALAALTAALCLEMVWQVTVGGLDSGLRTANWLGTVLPVHYQGWVLGASAVAMFVLVRSVAHPESVWARPRAARWSRSVGDLALGVFATHLLVLMLLQHVPGHHWPDGAKTIPQLFALCTATVLGATLLTMAIKAIPVLRRAV